jgi:hypothetical protein
MKEILALIMHWQLNVWMIPKSKGCSWLVWLAGRKRTLMLLKNVMFFG